MAVKEVERKYATLEAFALSVFSHPERATLMSPRTSYQKKAEMLGLSTQATVYLLAMSKRFQRLMKELSIANHWNFEAQDEANKQFVADLKNEQERPSERVKVATYLNRELGIGAEEEQRGGLVINLTFGGESLANLSGKMQVGLAGDTQVLDPHGNPVVPHRPAIAGTSDPAGVRSFADRTPLTAESLLGETTPGATLGQRVERTLSDQRTDPSPERYSPDATDKVADSATDSPTDVFPRY